MQIEHYELNPNKTENKISVKIIKVDHILHSVHVLINLTPSKLVRMIHGNLLVKP